MRQERAYSERINILAPFFIDAKMRQTERYAKEEGIWTKEKINEWLGVEA